MKVLAIDTSQPRGGLTLSTGESRSDTVVLASESSHLVGLGEATDALLRRAGVRAADIDRVAWVCGPGSFTGLRVGLSFVKGLYAGSEFELVTITSLELLALGVAGNPTRICTMIDARRDEVYAAVYRGADGSTSESLTSRRLACEMEPLAIAPGTLGESLRVEATWFVGSGAARYRPEIEAGLGPLAKFAPAESDRPSTELLASVGQTLRPLAPSEVPILEPFYIRESDARLQPLRRIRTHG